MSEVDAALEAPRPTAGEGFSDAVTFAFGDPRAGVFGLARAGLSDGGSSGLGILFSGRDVAAVSAATGGAAADWASVDAGGVRTTVDAPLERWTVALEADGGGFALEFSALGAPATFDTGGMRSYEHLCRVRGTARVDGRAVAVDCLGQRGHAWGAPDWEDMALARTLGVWADDGLAVLASAVRPGAAKSHATEDLQAVVLEGAPVVATAIEEPRLSTTYDGDGRQRRAGLELWADEESPAARRAAGEVVCGTSLDLGRLRLDCAFFAWRMEGREGVGRYDVLRRA